MAQLNREVYRQTLRALLPRGAAWSDDQDSLLMQLLDGLAAEPARLAALAEELRRELRPDRATRLLPEWEDSLVLDTNGETVETRRQRVASLLKTVGSLNPGYYVRLAERLGYRIRIEEHSAFRAGSRTGEKACGEAWDHAATVHAPTVTPRSLRAGFASGETLRTWGNELLESSIRKYWASHLVLWFAYSDETTF
ncbi:DUF2313 domain-containing protein [Kistimonas scapharcae]|uniref:DUF2313 domain-containing protein n=1 Tax=Kistimonas scapharcae TaxID=1036133 RepID=A0ABP8V703_9GAMM